MNTPHTTLTKRSSAREQYSTVVDVLSLSQPYTFSRSSTVVISSHGLIYRDASRHTRLRFSAESLHQNVNTSSIHLYRLTSPHLYWSVTSGANVYSEILCGWYSITYDIIKYNCVVGVVMRHGVKSDHYTLLQVRRYGVLYVFFTD